jgi:hypothetical protein
LEQKCIKGQQRKYKGGRGLARRNYPTFEVTDKRERIDSDDSIKILILKF